MDVSTLNYMLIAFSAFIGIVAGAAGMFFFRRFRLNREMRLAERKAARLQAEAELKGKEVLREAKVEAGKVRSQAETEYRERRSELQRNENRLVQKEATLDRKLEDVERRGRELTSKEEGIESIRGQLEEARGKQLERLELISGMSSDEAKQALLETMEIEMREETSRRLRQWEAQLKEEDKIFKIKIF